MLSESDYAEGRERLRKVQQSFRELRDTHPWFLRAVVEAKSLFDALSERFDAARQHDLWEAREVARALLKRGLVADPAARKRDDCVLVDLRGLCPIELKGRIPTGVPGDLSPQVEAASAAAALAVIELEDAFALSTPEAREQMNSKYLAAIEAGTHFEHPWVIVVGPPGDRPPPPDPGALDLRSALPEPTSSALSAASMKEYLRWRFAGNNGFENRKKPSQLGRFPDEEYRAIAMYRLAGLSEEPDPNPRRFPPEVAEEMRDCIRTWAKQRSARTGGVSATPVDQLVHALNNLHILSFNWRLFDELAQERARRRASMPVAAHAADIDPREEPKSRQSFLLAQISEAQELCEAAIAAINAGGAGPLDKTLSPGTQRWALTMSVEIKNASQTFGMLRAGVVLPRIVIDGEVKKILAFGEWCKGRGDELTAAMGLSVESLHATERLATQPPVVNQSRQTTPNVVFRKEGTRWRVEFQGVNGSFDDSVGMLHIATILSRRHEMVPVAALELMGNDPRDTAFNSSSDPVLSGDGIGAMKAEYERLNRELEEAERCADLAAVERVKAELAQIAAELSNATGMGGRTRELGPPSISQRARNTVTKALSRAYEMLEAGDPPQTALATHLRTSIRCEDASYRYHPSNPPIDWDLGFSDA